MSEDFIKVYKIRRRSDGKFSNGGSGGGFSKNGKTWESLGHVTSHLSNQMRGDDKHILSYRDCELVTIEIPVAGGATKDIKQLTDFIVQRRKLTKKYGSSFADLFTSLDKSDKLEDFRWCLILKTSTFSHEFNQFHELLVQNKLKRSQYRTAGVCISFADKGKAAMMRLASPVHCDSVDMVRASEVDLSDFKPI